MRLTLLIPIILTLSSCMQNTGKVKSDLPLSYLALGDSYTIGEGVNPQDRWPSQLANVLKANSKEQYNVNYIAQTGWTSKDLIDNIQSKKPARANLVSLLIGVNNQYQGLSFEKFKLEFDSLLVIAQSLCLKKNSLFVVSIPDYGYTPFGYVKKELISKQIDQYNDYINKRCKTLQIPYVNITPISRKLSIKPSGLQADDLHPSPSQYKAWVDEIIPTVLKIIP